MTKTPAIRRSSIRMRDEISFHLFISPWIIGFLCFIAWPMLYSLYAAFTNWNGVQTPVFIGVKNFVQIFTHDHLFFKSVANTLFFTIISVPLNLAVGLVLATLLNRRKFGSYFFRAVFYLPSVIAGVSIYITWSYLMNTDMGILNAMLNCLGLPSVGWLTDPSMAMWSVILINVTSCGGQMLIVLAGLQDIPRDYYESATIDGAGPIRQFFSITLPLLTPVVFFNMLMSMIAGLQVFTQPWVMTQGGPVNATYVYGIHLYNHAFRYYHFGYACALAWLLFVLILAITLVVFGTSGKWVFYREEA